MDEEQTIVTETVETPPVTKRAKRPVRKAKRPARKVQAKAQAEEKVDVTDEPPVKKHDVTAPWKQARILDIPAQYKRPGYTPRWCDTTRIGNIDKKIAEGWDFVRDHQGRKIQQVQQRTLMDGTPLDGTVQMRELVLMELPEDRKEARKTWLKSRTVTPEKLAKQYESDMAQAVGERGHTYFRAAKD